MDQARLEALKTAIAALPPGEFHLSRLYGPGWRELPIGDRVRLGRDFLTLVRAGAFLDVADSGRKRGGGRAYVKLG